MLFRASKQVQQLSCEHAIFVADVENIAEAQCDEFLQDEMVAGIINESRVHAELLNSAPDALREMK